MSAEPQAGGEAASGDLYDQSASLRPASVDPHPTGPRADGPFPPAPDQAERSGHGSIRPALSDAGRTGGRSTPPLGQPASAGVLATDWARSLPAADRGIGGALPASGSWPGAPLPGAPPAFGPATLPPATRPPGPLVKPVPGRRRAQARARTKRPSFRRHGRLADRIGFWRRLRSVVEIVFVTAVLGALLAGVVAVVVGAIVLALQKALH